MAVRRGRVRSSPARWGAGQYRDSPGFGYSTGQRGAVECDPSRSVMTILGAVAVPCVGVNICGFS